MSATGSCLAMLSRKILSFAGGKNPHGSYIVFTDNIFQIAGLSGCIGSLCLGRSAFFCLVAIYNQLKGIELCKFHFFPRATISVMSSCCSRALNPLLLNNRVQQIFERRSAIFLCLDKGPPLFLVLRGSISGQREWVHRCDYKAARFQADDLLREII